MDLDAQAYLLAAGRGRRAGGPKAWRDCAGRPLLERQLEFLKELFSPDRIAVSIQAGWLDRCRKLDSSVQWTVADPDAPALASLLALARGLPLRRWTFIHHVDMRVWERGLFTALAGRAKDCDAVAPVHEGRRGHPVLLAPALGRALDELDPQRDRLDVWLRGRRVIEVPVPYPRALDNWNQAAPGAGVP
ncbi:MAG: NTP transferase domain-containing protein [Elusimicrobia bacterium]|nr:NTP transferase domain-containing protein [Elusimicrobiota bacterium]